MATDQGMGYDGMDEDWRRQQEEARRNESGASSEDGSPSDGEGLPNEAGSSVPDAIEGLFTVFGFIGLAFAAIVIIGCIAILLSG